MKLKLLLFTLAIVLLSCDKKTKENEPVYIYAQQVYYSSAVAETNDLKQRQDAITLALETDSTNAELLNEFEVNAQRITQLQNFSEVLIGLVPSIGPIGPIPMPPEPCFETSNCVPKQNLTNIKGMVLHNDIRIMNITLYDSVIGNVVGSNFIPGDQFNNQNVFIFGDNLSLNITKMYSTVSVEGIENIILETPIVFE